MADLVTAGSHPALRGDRGGGRRRGGDTRRSEPEPEQDERDQPADPGRPGEPADGTGHFGPFGGRLAPEALMSALDELTAAYAAAKADPAFQAELRRAADRTTRAGRRC